MSISVSNPAADHLLSMYLQELADALAGMGEKPFRAKQIVQWVFVKRAVCFEEMTDLSQTLRKSLAGRFRIHTSQVVRRSVSSDGTVKLLLQWPDGATSECVVIPDQRRTTACVSSQVGCPVGCRFCASGLGGLQRNLTVGQIIEQVLRASAEADAAGGRLSNIVFMGLGEPLANYDAVIKAVRLINAPWGMNIGARKITISTVGLPKQIRKLAEEGLQLNLALSLHAPNDRLRRELIPWSQRLALDDLCDACREYFDLTGREITLEYILLRGVNDRPSHASELAAFAKRLRCNVNLLRYNPVAELPYERPSSQEADAFQRTLRSHGVNSHIRKSRGLDISAACGQLRREELLRDGPNLTISAISGPDRRSAALRADVAGGE